MLITIQNINLHFSMQIAHHNSKHILSQFFKKYLFNPQQCLILIEIPFHKAKFIHTITISIIIELNLILDKHNT